MSYRVELTERVKKEIKRLSTPDQKDALKAIFALRDDPQKGHTLKGSLKGARSLEFSLPGGAYRAAYYVITEDEVCLVFAVGSHERFYEKAERRAEALARLGLIKRSR